MNVKAGILSNVNQMALWKSWLKNYCGILFISAQSLSYSSPFLPKSSLIVSTMPIFMLHNAIMKYKFNNPR